MEIVTIRTFDNYFSANILLTRMRDAGIECYLKDEYTVTIDPLLSNAIGGIKLVVKKTIETEARKMLEDFDNAYKNYIACPNCGSHDVLLLPKQSTENFITAITSWLFQPMRFLLKMYTNAVYVVTKVKHCRNLLTLKMNNHEVHCHDTCPVCSHKVS